MGIHFRERDNFVRIVELTPALRREIETTIESLIALLDQYDGDENDEDDGCAEGWLSSGAEHHQPLWYGLTGVDDREEEPEHDENGGDDEPMLGAPEHHPTSWERDGFGQVLGRSGKLWHDAMAAHSQEFWAAGHGSARYDECEIENEHGGDILDEPHDAEPDDEHDHRDCFGEELESRIGKIAGL
jgi:hypothetical protein